MIVIEKKFDGYNSVRADWLSPFVCVTVQAGCAVGCSFCPAGQVAARTLTKEQILEQIHAHLDGTEKSLMVGMRSGDFAIAPTAMVDAMNEINKTVPTHAFYLTALPKLPAATYARAVDEALRSEGGYSLRVSLGTMNADGGRTYGKMDLAPFSDALKFMKMATEKTGRQTEVGLIVSADQPPAYDLLKQLPEGTYIAIDPLRDHHDQGIVDAKPAFAAADRLRDMGFVVDVYHWGMEPADERRMYLLEYVK
ncbi:hypothetical protein [Chromobacterium sp. ASV23]|uniref:hypothetical protein n=1 Tax=Chromobacterium sp. ASV23 TaxID=2795110 RepID=UPI0018EAA876|nr:hypothetical protein [Chromobacterium sp. ASV23]